MKTCPACGKKFVVMWPQLWAYKRNGNMFLCSWGCLRKFDKEEMENMTDETMREAVRIVLDGGIPTKFLREQGSRNPTTAWKTIRKWAMQQAEYKDAEIPEKFGRWPKAAEVPTVKIDGPIRIETPEPEKIKVVPGLPKITLPVEYDGMVIREVEGTFGRYRYTDIGSAEYIDFEGNEKLDTISLTVDQWKRFREEQVKAAAILGVEL